MRRVGFTSDSRKLEHGHRMISAGVPSSLGLGLADGHVPTFWLPLHIGLNGYRHRVEVFLKYMIP